MGEQEEAAAEAVDGLAPCLAPPVKQTQGRRGRASRHVCLPRCCRGEGRSPERGMSLHLSFQALKTPDESKSPDYSPKGEPFVILCLRASMPTLLPRVLTFPTRLAGNNNRLGMPAPAIAAVCVYSGDCNGDIGERGAFSGCQTRRPVFVILWPACWGSIRLRHQVSYRVCY